MGTQEKGTSSYKINCGLFIMSLSINTRKQAANNLPGKPHCGSSINYQSLLIKKLMESKKKKLMESLSSPGFAPPLLLSSAPFHLLTSLFAPCWYTSRESTSLQESWQRPYRKLCLLSAVVCGLVFLSCMCSLSFFLFSNSVILS